MNARHAVGQPVTIELELVAVPGYDPHHFLDEKWQDMFPGAVIVKCAHCGQWAARKTACGSCGAPVG